MSSLGEELPRQMARLARKAAHQAGYADPRVYPTADQIFAALDRAAEAIATQDIIGYIRCHSELKALEA